ncbi:MAG: hypothetical protein PHY43_01240 [Verrucomicrobiales bacterium]|nr:hypothetical protein [Verrucomicrobiales bacterium]
MRGVRNSLVLFAAGVVIAGAAPVQDESASFYQEMLTNSTARITLEMNAEPQLELGSNLQLTGLFVDCVMPQETWDMLDPSVPSARNPQELVPPSLLPVMPLRPINDPAVHEPDFALLRLSFP